MPALFEFAYLQRAMIPIPDSIDDVDARWLSDVLAQPVVSFDRSFLEGGVLSDAFRLHEIRYASPRSEAPASVVIKLPTAFEMRRDMAAENQAYLKELSFFRDLAETVPLRVPAAYHVASDGSEDAARFVLVLEDLSAHSRVFDQIDDTPDEHFMSKIALEVAGLHAAYWESSELDQAWLSRGDHRYVFAFDSGCREAPDRIDEFVMLWRRMYDRELYDEGATANAEAITASLTGRSSRQLLDRIAERLSTRPHTLLHGDLRADNIFRTDPSQGLSVEDSRLTYIDWQLMAAGPAGIDFAQAWIHSLPPEVRRKDTSVLQTYHERLVALNSAARDYPLETLIEDYVLGTCLWWAALITIGANTLPDFEDPGSARMKRLWELAIPRALITPEDNDALGVLERIGRS